MIAAVLFQSVPIPSPNDAPWPWVATLAVMGLGVVFWQLLAAKDQIAKTERERAQRCEGREDSLVAADVRKTEVIRDQKEVIVKASEVAGQAASASLGNRDLLQGLGVKVDDLTRRTDDAVAELRRSSGR